MLSDNTSKVADDTSKEPGTRRILGVLRPEWKQEFLQNARQILGAELRWARSFEEGVDIADLPKDIAVYFDSFDLVSTAVDIRDDRYAKYFSSTAIEQSVRPLEIAESPTETSAPGCLHDDFDRTWGMEITNAVRSRFTGDGIKVAVLDTGIDTSHEAFRGLTIQTFTFVTDPVTKDDTGHGTHCAATICGRPDTATGRRYGVAPKVQLFFGKIFDGTPGCPDSRTLRALQWAIDQGCHIISLSIGAKIGTGAPHSGPIEHAVALVKDTVLIVAGVGNDSRRPNKLLAVNHPANCPSILGVGAIDECLKIGKHSNREFVPNGGEVDLVAPGLRILSAQANTPNKYRLMDGTSAATPYVAGIAALWAQKSGKRGDALGQLVRSKAKKLAVHDPKDAGDGRVLAP